MHEKADQNCEAGGSSEDEASGTAATNTAAPVGACPVCEGTQTARLLDICDAPVFCNVLWPTEQQALEAATGDIALSYCRGCGHVFNSAFETSKTTYSAAYENSLHFSQHFSSYASGLARYLVDTYDVRHKDVIDVGCGRGDFLSVLCSVGDNRGYGFDKSYAPSEHGECTASQMTFVSDFYGPRYASYPCDLLSCRHVLEHIEQPNAFLDEIRSATEDKRDVVMFFEVPNAAYTLRDLGIWDLIYEHCSYYSANSLQHLFARHGFPIARISELYDGQFLGIECAPNGGAAVACVPTNDAVEDCQTFPARYKEKLAHWRTVMGDLAEQGLRAVVWGAGSKGVTFLNLLRPSAVDCVVDLNPRKHGRFVPGTGQEVVAPERLLSIKPDVVIVMNAVYANEISSALAAMGLSPQLLLA
ncbi:MAG: class I SAM-dependent methyltransferase [Hyphomicrobium sp.]|jgi:hypothetical protein